VTIVASEPDEVEQAIRGLRSVAFEDVSGYVLGGGDEVTGSVRIEELEDLIADGATVLDVRDKDERDVGYIPGSRNVPYRLMRTCCPDLPEDRPIVTICGSGPRAAIAASILRAKGLDARPVIDGGMDDWLARGETTVSFRRCGG
jgi:rhodanese-related sulfurtransferase